MTATAKPFFGVFWSETLESTPVLCEVDGGVCYEAYATKAKAEEQAIKAAAFGEGIYTSAPIAAGTRVFDYDTDQETVAGEHTIETTYDARVLASLSRKNRIVDATKAKLAEIHDRQMGHLVRAQPRDTVVFSVFRKQRGTAQGLLEIQRVVGVRRARKMWRTLFRIYGGRDDMWFIVTSSTTLKPGGPGRSFYAGEYRDRMKRTNAAWFNLACLMVRRELQDYVAGRREDSRFGDLSKARGWLFEARRARVRDAK